MAHISPPNFFQQLESINSRPKAFEVYSAPDLWTDPFTSQKMLQFHLNGDVDISSYNSTFINESIEWIASYFQLNSQTKIVDFGCGPGLYTHKLASKNAQVTGVDFSQNSIEYAKKQAQIHNLNINYIHQNYLDFTSDHQFDLALMIMRDYCVLSPSQRKTLLTKFYSLLKPGASLLFDVDSLNFFHKQKELALYQLNQLNGFWSPNNYYGFMNVFKYELEKVILHKYTIVEPHKSRTIYNWIQCFTPESIQSELQNHGFTVTKLLLDVRGNPFNNDSDSFAIVATKL